MKLTGSMINPWLLLLNKLILRRRSSRVNVRSLGVYLLALPLPVW